MCDVTRPHVDSFNWMLKEGLMKAAGVSRKKTNIYLMNFIFTLQAILPLEFETNTKLRVKLKFVVCIYVFLKR